MNTCQKILVVAFAIPSANATFAGCANDSTIDPEYSASVGLALRTTRPGCAEITVAGSRITVTNISTGPNAEEISTIEGLPWNEVLSVRGKWWSTTCGDGTPKYLAGPVSVSLSMDEPTPRIDLPFNGNASLNINAPFEGKTNSPGFACSSELTRVPREAMALDANAALGTGLRAVYDDGDERIEGPFDFGPYTSGGSAPSYYPADVLADATAPALWQSIWSSGGATITGYLVAPRSGTVTFTISADDYATLDLGENGDALSMVVADVGAASGTATLIEGQRYPVSIRYMNRSGSNWFRWYWSCPAE